MATAHREELLHAQLADQPEHADLASALAATSIVHPFVQHTEVEKLALPSMPWTPQPGRMHPERDALNEDALGSSMPAVRLSEVSEELRKRGRVLAPQEYEAYKRVRAQGA